MPAKRPLHHPIDEVHIVGMHLLEPLTCREGAPELPGGKAQVGARVLNMWICKSSWPFGVISQEMSKATLSRMRSRPSSARSCLKVSVSTGSRYHLEGQDVDPRRVSMRTHSRPRRLGRGPVCFLSRRYGGDRTRHDSCAGTLDMRHSDYPRPLEQHRSMTGRSDRPQPRDMFRITKTLKARS